VLQAYYIRLKWEDQGDVCSFDQRYFYHQNKGSIGGKEIKQRETYSRTRLVHWTSSGITKVKYYPRNLKDYRGVVNMFGLTEALLTAWKTKRYGLTSFDALY